MVAVFISNIKYFIVQLMHSDKAHIDKHSGTIPVILARSDFGSLMMVPA